jgi:hypothetical protein
LACICHGWRAWRSEPWQNAGREQSQLQEVAFSEWQAVNLAALHHFAQPRRIGRQLTHLRGDGNRFAFAGNGRMQVNARVRIHLNANIFGTCRLKLSGSGGDGSGRQIQKPVETGQIGPAFRAMACAESDAVIAAPPMGRLEGSVT